MGSQDIIDGVKVPDRSDDSWKAVEAALKNKINRLRIELGEVQKDKARLTLALENERGKSEEFRQKWIDASHTQRKI